MTTRILSAARRRPWRSLVAVTTAAALVATLTGAASATEQAGATVATADDPVTHKENSRVPEGAAWTQHYFPSSDGSTVELHADVLRPEGLPDGRKLPVILSVGPYFGHSGQLDFEHPAHTGPSGRFGDLVEGADLLGRGYALVMVDLRGFGGSTGCLDATGPGDQADIKAAIDWAASQPWSTGAVGMYGKSFDAMTGLVGNNLNHDALKAVVAQEPIWDLYRNIRSNGVPRTTAVSVSNAYEKIATLPQLPDDDSRYRAAADYEKAHPECLLTNRLGYQTADPDSEYWKARDYANLAKGSDTPLFFTQGMAEWNTEPEAMQEFLANHQGPERGWIGPWDHVRGNDRGEDGRLKMGREGWFAETMSFFDQYLKGVEPSVQYPNYAVQDNNGAWRAQDTWPVVSKSATVPLGGGSYVDSGAEAGPAPDDSFVHRSAPLGQATRVTGTPRISLNTARGFGTVMVRLHDVAPDGTATVFDEQVSTIGPGNTAFDFKAADWTLPAGHSLAVEIGTTQANVLGDWLDTPTGNTIAITGAEIELPLDSPSDDQATPGARAPYLDTYLLLNKTKPATGEPSFTLPPATP
ncbi:CocE/NonD family hydrolase [Amycolatopsis sp. NPDC089917]|uniref:CocE/NonD family hydrolase n=1 Tax=Amycolatopsis sp. NPDC089917 TaxID=3155187 RepID=UPI003422E757